MSNKLLEELAEFRKNQKNDPTEQTEPIESPIEEENTY